MNLPEQKRNYEKNPVIEMKGYEKEAFQSYETILEELKRKEKSPNTIKVAEVTHSIFYAPFYVAIENNYFHDNGLDIDLILTPGADKVSAAVLSNDVQIGYTPCLFDNGTYNIYTDSSPLYGDDVTFVRELNFSGTHF